MKDGKIGPAQFKISASKAYTIDELRSLVEPYRKQFSYVRRREIAEVLTAFLNDLENERIPNEQANNEARRDS